MREWRDHGAAVTAFLLAVPGVVLGVSTGLDGGVPLVVAGATLLTCAVGYTSVRFVGPRSVTAAWLLVWLAAFAWCNTILFASGDPVGPRIVWSTLLAAIGTLAVLALVHLSPWNPAHRRMDITCRRSAP